MNRKIGAEYINNNTCNFVVWAPDAETVDVVFKERDEPVSLEKVEHGYWKNTISGVKPGSLYQFLLDGKKKHPDPASRSQPEGVHSWSRVIEQNNFSWTDKDWKGLPLSEMILYELHIGTYTEAGTFEAMLEKLDHLKELGINTVEIMPVSQFPGNRNWGYDGVYPFAAQDSYGGAKGLKKLVNTCHENGFAVILDVVYNHMGPEGNYLSEYGPYFTDKYKTPWGSALNFDDKYSDEVRNFFIQNALMWLEEFHFDGLRLDAIHEIIDRGARPFLRELSRQVDKLEDRTGRNYVVIAESDLNDVKIVNPYEKGGFGIEGQWVDDFHHSLHTILTGEKDGYYQDFGEISQLAKSFEQGFVYDGVYSEFRKRKVGNDPSNLPPSKFVISIQNHDQVGNRMLGDRLAKLVSPEELKLAAGIMLISPLTPMLFMGEEFAEDQPFQYFVSHEDPELVKAVQEGRKREFKYFFSEGEGEFPDPQSRETFNNSKLNWSFKNNDQKRMIFEYYKELIRLRKNGSFETFRNTITRIEVDEDHQLIRVSAEKKENGKAFAVFNFNSSAREINLPKSKSWNLLIASADEKWGGAKKFPEMFTENDSIDIPPNSLIICENKG